MSRITSILVFALLVSHVAASEEAPLLFNTSDHGEPGDKAPLVTPWKSFALDADYGGQWVVTGDLDGDGEAEVVSARNVNEGDVHYTSAVVAHRLDGSVLWRWGDPTVGRRKLHHDVACQIYDWNGDGKNEVVLCGDGFLIELNGKTGKEQRRFAIPPEASDCLVFVNVSGNPKATDVLVKTRYGQIWAYDATGKLLWTVENPGGYRTAHQPRPVDIEGDGRDEILAGYALLNHDGSVRWTYKSEAVDQSRGHADCWRVLQRGATPDEYRLVLTCCGANNIAVVDGNGAVQWELSGRHFESIKVGKILPNVPRLQILVDIDHQPPGESPIWVLDANGKQLGSLMSDYCRHHTLVDWTGDGVMEFVVANAQAVFDRSGKRIATLQGLPDESDGETLVIPGDMTGDGIPDITLAVPSSPCRLYVFKNEKGTKSPDAGVLGCGVNFTLY